MARRTRYGLANYRYKVPRAAPTITTSAAAVDESAADADVARVLQQRCAADGPALRQRVRAKQQASKG